jgi:hypothetical protein
MRRRGFITLLRGAAMWLSGAYLVALYFFAA